LAHGILRCDRAHTGSRQEPAHGVVSAILVAAEQLRALQARAHDLGAEVLAFQLELLEDDSLVFELLKAVDAGASPQEAIHRVFGRQIAAFEESDSERFASRGADLADLRDRLLGALRGKSGVNEDWPDETILFVHDLTPSRYLALDRSKVIGIVDREGSTASHVALLARSEGVPMLVGAGALAGSDEGRPVLLDGERGELVIEPAAERSAPHAPAVPLSDEAAAGTARLANGEAVAIQLTVNSLDGLADTPPDWFDGIGLVRSELLIRDAQLLHDAEAQAALYRPLFDWAGERPVVIRLIDAGGDKQVPGLALSGADAGFLGLRGARLLRRRPEVLRVQLAAILSAAGANAVRIMVPMITLPEEMAFFRTELGHALAAAGADAGRAKLGMMIETPAAALRVAHFDADFFSLGTNDLTQYTLAASREGDVLSGREEELPEAVLELVRRVVDHGLESGRPVTMCGDVGPSAAGLGRLLHCGVRSFCVPPRLVAPFKHFIRTAS
jgi:phosphotransferase system enzyme I (PtsI)